MLDPIQLQVKNKLGLNYSQINAYKIIYDFIGRFSFCQYTGNNIYAKDVPLYAVKLDLGTYKVDIPTETRKLLEKIGTHSIHLFFSPHAYPKKFEDFCKKMLNKRATMKEYYTAGLICVERDNMIEVTYES